MPVVVKIYTNKPVKQECFHCGSKFTEPKLLFEDILPHSLSDEAERLGLYYDIWQQKKSVKIQELSEKFNAAQKIIKRTKSCPTKTLLQSAAKINMKDFVKGVLNVIKEDPTAILTAKSDM